MGGIYFEVLCGGWKSSNRIRNFRETDSLFILSLESVVEMYGLGGWWWYLIPGFERDRNSSQGRAD